VVSFVGFEVLTAVVMKSSVFWDIIPIVCSKSADVSEKRRPHLQGQRISQATSVDFQRTTRRYISEGRTSQWSALFSDGFTLWDGLRTIQ
jgi:hypothetical protein